MNLEIIDVTQSEEPRKSGKGKYGVLTVTYKSEDGRVGAKKLMDFACPFWDVITKAEKGSVWNVEQVKEGQYWNWTAIHRQDGPMKVQDKNIPVPSKPTYETPEERAQKQVMIVRQSSLATAVNFWALLEKQIHPKSPLDIIQTARNFENYVMGNMVEDMNSDVPH